MVIIKCRSQRQGRRWGEKEKLLDGDLDPDTGIAQTIAGCHHKAERQS